VRALRAVALSAVLVGCAHPQAPATAHAPAAGPPADDGVAGFVVAEGQALEWVAASDPRLAARLGFKAPKAVLDRIGMGAVLAEDTTAAIHDDALDLFGFRARAHALEEAAKVAGSAPASLPDTARGAVERPRLERELLERLVDEERARAAEEALLGEASGALVRGILATWSAPEDAQAWQDRDAWVAKHLLEIQKSLQDGRPRSGPIDLDEALYPLERLLAPSQFPKGAAALAKVRIALDEDTRPAPALVAPERVARTIKVHLGLDLDVAAARARLERVGSRLRDRAGKILADAPDRGAVEARARNLLFVEGRCPTPAGSPLRAAGPPPERAAICGLLGALADEGSRKAAVVALHDDVLLALAAVTPAPPPRTALLSKPDDDKVDALRRMARERPVVALGLALAGDILFGDDPSADDARLRAWAALGEAPLDVVERELGAQK
jgi:hypothetical protein